MGGCYIEKMAQRGYVVGARYDIGLVDSARLAGMWCRCRDLAVVGHQARTRVPVQRGHVIFGRRLLQLFGGPTKGSHAIVLGLTLKKNCVSATPWTSSRPRSAAPRRVMSFLRRFPCVAPNEEPRALRNALDGAFCYVPTTDQARDINVEAVRSTARRQAAQAGPDPRLEFEATATTHRNQALEPLMGRMLGSADDARRRPHESYRSGGSGEIRTHGRVAPSLVFKTSALNRSATLPATRF
jgi:hypothetical protein